MASTQEVELPTIYKLPAELEQKIGHAIVGFSYLEFLLSRITYDLLGIGQKEGRLVVKEPRAHERVEAIADLIALQNLDIDVDLKVLTTLVENLEKSRNQLAHGVWMEHPNTHQLFLRITSGTWKPDTKAPSKVRRIIKPEGREYGLPEVTVLCDQIDQTTRIALDLAREIVNKIPTLREKYLEQPPTG